MRKSRKKLPTFEGFEILSFVDGFVTLKFRDELKIGEVAEMMADMVNDSSFIAKLCDGYNVHTEDFVAILCRHNTTMLIIHPEDTAKNVIDLYAKKRERAAKAKPKAAARRKS